MLLLAALAAAGALLGLLGLTLCIAAGLYHLSELAEDHTARAKRVLQRLTVTCAIIHLLLQLIEPAFARAWLCTALSLAAHATYYSAASQLPLLHASSPRFIASCVLCVLTHWLWTRHFRINAHAHIRAKIRPQFAEIAAFFGLLVWAIPFLLVVALSAGDYFLPRAKQGVNGNGRR